MLGAASFNNSFVAAPFLTFVIVRNSNEQSATP